MEQGIIKEVFHYCNITTQKCLKLSKEIINYYDFTFVLEGSMVYYANGQKIVLTKNDAIFFKPGTLRSRDTGTKMVRYVSFNFHINSGIQLPFDDYMPECITADVRKLVSVYPPSHLSPFYHSREKCSCVLNYILLGVCETPQAA